MPVKRTLRLAAAFLAALSLFRPGVQGLDDLTGPLGRSLYLNFTRQVNVSGG